MSDQPLVSIIMPAKNVASYIEACIDSIIAQTYASWELHVVDDHSADTTLDILKMYAALDPRIKVYSNAGNGIIPALQLAISHIAGSLVTRMDADDIMAPVKLEKMVDGLISSGRGHVVVGKVKYFAAGGVGDGYQRYEQWLNEMTTSACNFDYIYKECVIPSPCWMMYTDDFNRCGGVASNIYPEDYDLCFRMRSAGYKVVGIDHILHHWRDHVGRASRNDPNYSDNRFLALKCHYFLSDDYNRDLPLLLYGAGKKAKWIAQYLIEHGVEFDWITNNPNKIGRDIYGKILKTEDILDRMQQVQTIIAIANPDQQISVISRLGNRGDALARDYFLFC